MKEKGQVIIVLLLIMIVLLTLGLSMVGRSTTEITTSTKTEDSSRAFSAAEAGLEKSLKADSAVPIPTGFLSNKASADVTRYDLPPANTALEYPAFGKESFAQFWLADPSTTGQSYVQPSFDIYFGDYNQSYSGNSANEANAPAVEIHVISKNNSGGYESLRKYIDSYSGTSDASRVGNSFNDCDLRASAGNPLKLVTNNNAPNQSLFYCMANITGYPYTGGGYPVMVRVRILYSSLRHPVAVAPKNSGSLPPQASIYTSTGKAGETQRTLQVFKQKYAMPNYFDFVLFSAAQLNK